MTRQISEAVRIDLRGGGVLNSRSEFSRCRIPRLVIDQEGWKRNKLEEKKKLEEKAYFEKLDMAEDGWEEWVSNLSEDKLEMEAGQNKTST